MTYTDLVLAAHECVKDIGDNNKVEFHMNLGLFCEGLQEDIQEFEDGREVRHLPVRPKEQQDVE